MFRFRHMEHDIMVVTKSKGMMNLNLVFLDTQKIIVSNILGCFIK
jgi:hypothetical protein